MAPFPERRRAWDSVVAAGVTATLADRTPSAYAAAVRAMIGWLDDPASQVLAAPSRPLANRWRAQRDADGTLVVTLVDGMNGRLASAFRSAIALAPRVIFDLRRAAPRAAAALFDDADFTTILSPVAVVAARQRTRRYSGYSLDAPSNRSSYSVDWQLIDTTIITPRAGVADKQVVFVVCANAIAPPVAFALQRAGRGAIVAEGPVLDAATVRTYRMRLADGISVGVRTSELVNGDGTTGAKADTIIGTRTSGADAALAAALQFAVVARQQGPATQHPVPSADDVPSTPAIRAPASLYPNVGLRIVAAYSLWNVVRHFYPYKRLIDERWDQVLRDAIPTLAAARDSIAYIAAIAQLATHLHDSHTRIAGPAEGLFWGAADIPVRVRRIDGVPVITALTSDSAGQVTGLAVGDVIAAVDGEPSAARWARLASYTAASTPQGLDAAVANYFLRGPLASTAALTVRGPDEVTRTVSVTRVKRSALSAAPERTGPVYQVLPGNIGYADLDRLQVSQLDSMLDALKDTKAIVFDMRGYPHGVAWPLAPRLSRTNEPVRAAQLTRPVISSPDTAAADSLHLAVGFGAATKSRYSGETVMLIDERTISEAEHTGLFLRAANGTKFIGMPTAGADGDVTAVWLPGNLPVVFTGQTFTWLDGGQLQRKGLQPDIRVAPTVGGIRAGRDEVLDRAVEYLAVEKPR